MPDYKQGKIYCIRSHQTENIYIGSTTQTLAQRLGKHRSCYKNHNDEKYHYVSSFELLKYDDHYIELIELFPCSCKAELHKREGELIRENDCVNKCIPGRTQREYRDNNKQKYKEQGKQWREKNKTKIKQKRKEYREKNKEIINEKDRQYCKENTKRLLEYQKQYRNNNKQKISERDKRYRKNNIEKMREYDKKRNSIKITCECGSTVIKRRLKIHQKTEKHLNWVRLQ
jgi:hypothetical protein